jgi:hypothetical protein
MPKDPILPKRIAHIKETVRMTDVMRHFRYGYRTEGNMLCCWHEERNPSARLYENQNTYWCWVCAPGRGVDVIEFVLLELGLEEDLEGVPEAKRHGIALYKALEYIEANFAGAEYQAAPYMERIAKATGPRPTPPVDPERYWAEQHMALLRQVQTTLAEPVPAQAVWMAYEKAAVQMMDLRLTPPEQFERERLTNAMQVLRLGPFASGSSPRGDGHPSS